MKNHTSFLRGLGLASLMFVSVGLSACNDDDDDGPVLPSGERVTRELIVYATTESAEPIDVNNLNLEFSEDPDAFDDLLD